jgi:hypothetical protein
MVSLALLMLACLIMAAAARPMPITTTAGLLDSSSTSNGRALLQHLGSTIGSSPLCHLVTKPVNHASQKAANTLAKVGSSWLVHVVARLPACTLPRSVQCKSLHSIVLAPKRTLQIAGCNLWI